MSKNATIEDGYKILREALYGIKDAPLSREEMIETAEKALKWCNQWGVES